MAIRNYLNLISGISLGLPVLLLILVLTLISAFGTTFIADAIYWKRTGEKYHLQTATWLVAVIYRVGINLIVLLLPRNLQIGQFSFNFCLYAYWVVSVIYVYYIWTGINNSFLNEKYADLNDDPATRAGCMICGWMAFAIPMFLLSFGSRSIGESLGWEHYLTLIVIIAIIGLTIVKTAITLIDFNERFGDVRPSKLAKQMSDKLKERAHHSRYDEDSEDSKEEG